MGSPSGLPVVVFHSRASPLSPVPIAGIAMLPIAVASFVPSGLKATTAAPRCGFIVSPSDLPVAASHSRARSRLRLRA